MRNRAMRNRSGSGSFVSPQETAQLSFSGRDFMSDNDGGHDTDHTTIIETGGGGGGGVLAVVLLIIVVLVLLFVFRDQLGFGSKTTEIKVPDKIEVNIN
jgi:uncharacterized membrane protein